MAQYSVTNLLGGTQQNLSSTLITLWYGYATTGATTLRRGYVYEVDVGLDGAPNNTDCAVTWRWDRATSGDGTATTITPPPLDISDAAALLTYKANFTVEPTTVTAASALLTLALNQRNSQRVIFRDDVSAMIIPATNNAGIVSRAKSATYASTAISQAYVRE